METGSKPAVELTGYLKRMGPDWTVNMARQLCSQLLGEPESFHGNIWPGNVRLDDADRAILGHPSAVAAAQRSADEVEFAAPEYFWDGAASAAADVFSVGLLLYAGCNRGYLPFQPTSGTPSKKDRATALRRRMKGEVVKAPAGISPELAAVIEKALAYSPENRYLTAKELLAALNETDEALPGGSGAAVSDGAAAAAASVLVTQMEQIVPETAPVEAETVPVEETPVEVAEEPVMEPPDAEEFAAEEAAPEFVEEPAPAEPDEPAEVWEDEPVVETEEPVEEIEDEIIEQPVEEPVEEAAGEAMEDAVEEAIEEPLGEAIEEPVQVAMANVAVADEPAVEETAGEAEPEKETVAAAAAAATARRQYTVQKDFENRGARRTNAGTAANSKGKKKRSAVPAVVSAVLAVGILGGVGYMVFGGDKPEESPTFVMAPKDDEEAPPPSDAEPSPIVITPAPTDAPEEKVKTTPAPDDENAGDPDGETAAAAETAGTGGAGGNGGGSQSGSTTNAGSNAGSGSGSGSGSNSGSGSGSGSSGGGSGSGGTSSPGYTVTPADDTVYVIGAVNVRSGPGTEYAILGVAQPGETLKRTGTTGKWSRVEYNGGTGFVSNGYISATDPTVTPKPTATPAPTATPVPTATPTPTATPDAPPAEKFAATKGDVSYADAKKAADDAGGLAILADDGDFDNAAQALEDAGIEAAWIGAEYADGAWQWSDGTALKDDDEHWADGHPDKNADAVLLVKNGDTWEYVSVNAEKALTDYEGKLGYIAATA